MNGVRRRLDRCNFTRQDTHTQLHIRALCTINIRHVRRLKAVFMGPDPIRDRVLCSCFGAQKSLLEPIFDCGCHISWTTAVACVKNEITSKLKKSATVRQYSIVVKKIETRVDYSTSTHSQNISSSNLGKGCRGCAYLFCRWHCPCTMTSETCMSISFLGIVGGRTTRKSRLGGVFHVLATS